MRVRITRSHLWLSQGESRNRKDTKIRSEEFDMVFASKTKIILPVPLLYNIFIMWLQLMVLRGLLRIKAEIICTYYK